MLMSNIKNLFRAIAAAVIFSTMAGALVAQWPSFPTPNVPKLPDGKPNMDGPTPRTADGKPDLSGIWQFEGNRGLRPPAAPGVIAGSGAAPAPAGSAASGTPPAPPPAGGIGLGPRRPGPNQFFDIGSTLKDGLPFTPWAVAVRKERKENNNKDNPDAHCLPLGLMQLHTHPQPRKIVQLPNLIVILYEAQAGVRQIFMDGRTLPNNDP